uniref:Nucleophosmin/nucleoplasmin 2 n=1 Tax=Buteo japonicus TaxID=224669 RepID=A0A8B9Z2V1_9AVES
CSPRVLWDRGGGSAETPTSRGGTEGLFCSLPHSDTSLPAGCELSSERDSYTFQVPEEWQCEQQLALRTICLGEMARDEFHVVEIVLAEGGARSPVPLATLKPSVLPMVSATLMGVELTPPVTFHLRAGSGPVYISGQHVSSKYWGTTAPCPLLGSGGSASCSHSDVQPVLG